MAPGSRTSLVNIQPMPMIVEDDDSPPPTLPEKSHRRSTLNRVSYPAYGPPSYAASTKSSTFLDRQGVLHREGLRDQEWFARRGGWYRLGILVFFLTTLAAGLAVGLTIGLRRSSPDDESSPSPISNLFPAGSYSFTVALTNVSTACTTNPAAFRCYPYTTYSPSSPSASSATFTWIISPVNSYQYVISSAPNPFAPQFSNLTMTLLDGNQYTERYTFNFTFSQAVVPAGPLSSGEGDETATCWFNSTVLTATLWTRQRATYPTAVTTLPAPANASDSFAAWPFAVEVHEVQVAGPGVPDCTNLNGLSAGDYGVSDPDDGDLCGCWYANFGLGNGTSTRRAMRRWEVG